MICVAKSQEEFSRSNPQTY